MECSKQRSTSAVKDTWDMFIITKSMIYLVSEGSTYVEPVSNFVGAQQTSNPFMECFLV